MYLVSGLLHCLLLSVVVVVVVVQMEGAVRDFHFVLLMLALVKQGAPNLLLLFVDDECKLWRFRPLRLLPMFVVAKHLLPAPLFFSSSASFLISWFDWPI